MSEFKRQLEFLKSKVSKPKAEEPVPFRLLCSCGEMHQGIRSPTWKRVECAICGTSLFILPKDVYPVPRQKGEAAASPFTAVADRLAGLFARSQTPTAPTAVAASTPVVEDIPEDVEEVTELGDDDEVDLFEEPAPQPTRSKSKGTRPRRQKRAETSGTKPRRRAEPRPAPRPKKRPAASPSPVPAPAKSVEVPDDAPERELASLFDHAERQQSSRRLITPVRLIALAMMLLVCATTYFMWYRSQLSSAGQRFREAYANGQQLVSDREFSQAVLQLRTAEEAASILQREDQEAAHASQLLREATAVTNLSDTDLIEWLQTGIGRGDAETPELAERMVRLQNEKWFVFDAWVRPGTDGVPQVECPFVVAGRDVRIACATDRLLANGEAARCVFAAQISAVQGLSQPSAPWLIQLLPESVTPFTNPDICAELGLLEIDPRLGELLEAQAARLGFAAADTQGAGT